MRYRLGSSDFSTGDDNNLDVLCLEISRLRRTPL